MASPALHKAVERNDVTMCKTLMENGESVGMKNLKGETPLHIAAVGKTNSEIVRLLLEAGSDVNARNRWGQTPLHHAAFGQNLETLQLMLAVKGLNINQTDVSGYTPLHALVYASENVSRNFRKCFEKLIASGADVNARTKFGHSILHLVCNKFNNIEILRYLLSTVPGIRCDQTNENQENVLHSFVMRGLDEDANELFRDFIENRVPPCNSQMFMQLINQQDIYGQTPFYMCLDSQELSMSTIKMLLDNGANVNICDNLGNSILHRIVALSLRNCSDVVNLLCTAGADPNAANDQKQSVISLVDKPEVLNVLLKAKADPNKVDNSGRNALAYAAKHKDETLINLLVTSENVDHRDFSGNTALHFAAYHNNTKACQDLLQAGCDANIINSEGYTALDLAIYHGNIDSIHCLIGYKHTVPVDIYQRIKSARNVLRDLPEAIKADELNDLSNIIKAPSDANMFLKSLLTTNGIGKVIEVREANDIQQQVQSFVETLCKNVSSYDARFTMSVFPTGSSAEGTKVGRPDEFDFVLCLEKIGAICEVVEAVNGQDPAQDSAFVRLRHCTDVIDDDFFPFFDENGYFMTWPALQELFVLLRRALFEKGIPVNSNIYFKFENDLRHLSAKPVFNLTLIWMGDLFKELEISVDLVPGVRVTNWWPSYIDTTRLELITDQIHTAGCILLLQSQSSDQENLIICGMDDCLHDARCFRDENRDEEKEEHIATAKEEVVNKELVRTLLRISTAPAEICLMKSFPQVVRDSYIAAKILKANSPDIMIKPVSEASAFKLLGLPLFKIEYMKIRTNAEMSSYILKNCVFHAVAKTGWRHGQDIQLSCLQLTIKVFEHLGSYVDDLFLPPYFLPFVDIFTFEKLQIERSDSNILLGFSILHQSRIPKMIKPILFLLGKGDEEMAESMKN